MQKQSAYIREFHAITEALAKFRHYLLGHKFIIRTDQKSLKELLEQRLQTPEQQQWLPKFLGYDFVIQYKPGRENLPANALSRSFLMAWLEAVGVWMNQVSALLQEDNSLAAIYKQCMEGTVQGTEYAVKDGLLFWKGRMMIPSNKELKEQIMQEFHASKIGGHEGVTKSVSRICKQFYWPKMQQDIRDFVRQCIICQQAKVEQALPAGLLQPLPIPQIFWEDIAMDFISNLPPSRGYATIFVVVDRLSKFAHFIPLKAAFNSKSVVNAFISNIVKMHGFPKTIVSDRDSIFINSFWQQLFKAQGTILAMSSVYHPQSDGQTEVLNKTLEMYLRCFVFYYPKAWVDMLPWAQFWYNTLFHHRLIALECLPSRLFLDVIHHQLFLMNLTLKIQPLCRTH